jgi:signal transduction histidine kinase
MFANLTRAAELVHSFKQVAADQVSSERRSFDMTTWTRELLTSLRPVLRKNGHTVSVECDPNVMVDTYPGALAQVLTNMIMNSVIHAYPSDTAGRLALHISQPAPETVRIVFSDDGRGIDPVALGKIFDPFYTTARNRGNTGLGLHIAYNLVSSVLQGRLEVKSSPGRGTQFTITMPKRLAESANDSPLVPA